MKKLIMSALAIAAIVFSVNANAQSFSLGLKAGALGTKIDGQSFESGYKLSYQGGAFAEIDLLNKIGIQPELLFSQTSSQTVSGPTGTTTLASGLNANTDFKLSYLSIPVLLRYNLAKVLTINLGPQYSILLNKNQDLVANGKSAFKSGDFALVAGLQVHVSSLRVYARYAVGLSNDNDYQSATNTENWKSQQIQVGVGLKVF